MFLSLAVASLIQDSARTGMASAAVTRVKPRQQPGWRANMKAVTFAGSLLLVTCVATACSEKTKQERSMW